MSTVQARDRTGAEIPVLDKQGRAAAFLYDTAVGNALLRVLVQPWVSRAAGWVLNRKFTRIAIKPFVKRYHINLAEYASGPYYSYNDFFCRPVLPWLRHVDPDPDVLIAPCDAKLSVYPISPDAEFTVKGVRYTLASLLRDDALAAQYTGGWLMLFRLSVDDYHHFCYPATGRKSITVRLPGVLHTVNPHAAEKRAVYRENARDYSVIDTGRFGRVLMMEVGALMVGRIAAQRQALDAVRGTEKGWFEFGGSSIILCVQPCVAPDADLLRNTQENFETVVKMGEHVAGIARPEPTGPAV